MRTSIDEGVSLALAIAIDHISLIEQRQRYGFLLEGDTVFDGVPEKKQASQSLAGEQANVCSLQNQASSRNAMQSTRSILLSKTHV